MKYCYHCGALLVESTASFCAECGKFLKAATISPELSEEEKTVEEEPAQTIPSTSKPVLPQTPASVPNQITGSRSQSGQPHFKSSNPTATKPKPPSGHRPPSPHKSKTPQFAARKKPLAKKPLAGKEAYRPARAEHQRRPDPRDAHYDGYYDDVRPGDKGNTREKLDPEMIKRVILIACGALVLIIFSVVIMTML